MDADTMLSPGYFPSTTFPLTTTLLLNVDTTQPYQAHASHSFLPDRTSQQAAETPLESLERQSGPVQEPRPHVRKPVYMSFVHTHTHKKH